MTAEKIINSILPPRSYLTVLKNGDILMTTPRQFGKTPLLSVSPMMIVDIPEEELSEWQKKFLEIVKGIDGE